MYKWSKENESEASTTVDSIAMENTDAEVEDADSENMEYSENSNYEDNADVLNSIFNS